MRAKGQIATRDGSSRMGLRPRESRDGRPALQLELNLLRDAEGVVDLDAEIADGAFRASYVRGGAARLSDCPSSSGLPAYWGPNYPKLQQLKKKYDPGGQFFVHHGVGSVRQPHFSIDPPPRFETR